MSDLISRKAVEKAIKEYFKMIIDETDDDVDCVLDYSKNLVDAIAEIPTAYDVNKVVEKIEHMDRTPLYTDEDSEEIIDYLLEESKIIEIVKRGGVDE